MFSADHHRRSIRLRGWDYTSAAAYFVTVVTHERQALFGDTVDGQVLLTEPGGIAAEEWVRTAEVRGNVELDEFVVMPNHVHRIIWIVGQRCDEAPCWGAGARRRLAPTLAAGSLGAIVGGYKSAVARRINALRGLKGAPVWQRNYYERVIRNERELDAIRRYIRDNPANWASDIENPRRP